MIFDGAGNVSRSRGVELFMEAMYARMATTGSTLASDKALRLAKRPDALGGQAFRDLGSTQWNATATPTPTQSRKREVRPLRPEAESDDEIDCFSSSNASCDDSDAICSRKKSATRRKARAQSTQVSTPSPSNRSGASTGVVSRSKPKKHAKPDATSVDKCSSTATQQTPRPRPKPRPVTRMPSYSDQSLFGRSDDDLESRPLNNSPQEDKQTEGTGANSDTQHVARPFPDLLPVHGDNGVNTLKTPTNANRKRQTGTKTKSKVKKTVTAFPCISPLSCAKDSAFIKSGTSLPEESDQELDDDDELAMCSDDEVLTRGGLRPFPMETSILKSISSIPHSPPEALTASPSKTNCVKTKKSARKTSRPLRNFPMTEDMFAGVQSTPSPEQKLSWKFPHESEDEELLSPVADPRTLCPYCDTRLPSSPTPTLMALISRAFKHKASYLDPRPANPQGRRAPVQVFIGVCQRHRFESEILPEAERRGWPKTIEWGALRQRVKQMVALLQGLIDDHADHSARQMQKGSYTAVSSSAQGPRAKCVFWQEVFKEVKAKGSRAVTGVRGQYSTFDKVQPGYYGEIGSVIIHQTLYDLFPPHKIDPTLTAPLTPDEFIRLVLVPEVGLRLIMEDKNLSPDSGIAEGVEILRASAKYGVAMFPEDEGEWGDATGHGNGDANENEGMGAVDMILLERARRRRRELELEEAEEDEEEILMSKAAQKKKRGIKHAKGTTQKQGGKEGKSVDTSDSREAIQPRPQPRLRPVQRFEPPTVLLPAPRFNRIPSRPEPSQSLSTCAQNVKVRTTQEHLNLRETLEARDSDHFSIDIDSSDSLEALESLYPVKSRSKRMTKSKGKHTSTGIPDSGSEMESVILPPVRIAADQEATPQSVPNRYEATCTQSSEAKGGTGPSDQGFCPLIAAREKKRKRNVTIGETHKRPSTELAFKMSTEICSSDDEEASNVSQKEDLSYLLGDSED